MKLSDVVIIFVLALLAAFVWLRDTTWMSSSDDTLPILVALPIFVWLGWPWRFLEHSGPIPKLPIAIAAILFVLGIGGNLTILLAIGWTLLLWTWLAARTDPADHSKIKKLLILPFMAFPWVTLDAGPLGWWFRLSGAHITAALYSLLGFNVIQEGTHILINSLPVSVEAACAGLNTLQSMLIAGSVVAFIFLGSSNRYWWNLPLLVVMAWFANTLRILVLVAAALIVSPEFALGAFHTWGGWLVLMVMFVCCWLIFSVQEPEPSESKPV